MENEIEDEIHYLRAALHKSVQKEVELQARILELTDLLKKVQDGAPTTASGILDIHERSKKQ